MCRATINDLRSWHLQYTHKKSHEIYTINSEIEAIRCNTVSNYSLLLHKDKGKKNLMGESKANFQLLPNDWKEIVDETIIRANLTENPKYTLPSPWELPSAKKNQIYDESLEENIPQELEKINHILSNMKASLLYGCHLASYEVFLEKYTTKIKNSQGLNLNIPSSKILWDFVLISKNKELEINNFSQRRFLRDFNWEKILQENSSQLIDLQESKLSPTGNFSVVMGDEALDTIFDYFTAQADGSALYHKYSSFKEETSIYENQQNAVEPLTIKTDPDLTGGMKSGFFETLGYPLSPLTIIADGVLQNFTIGGKFADLLNKPKTSALSNTIVSPGQTPYNDFLQEEVFELLKFSTFKPNPITGAFSGEIRLGYWHKAGKKYPIRGGSVSGVSQKSFLKARFSKEVVKRASYHGPKGVFFESITLAGE